MSKLLVINVSINRGSTGKIAEQIGNAAQQHGWDCYVGYGNYNLGSKMQTYHISNKWFKRLHALESRLLDNHGQSSRIATRRFIKVIERIQPDIIHLHNVHGYYINYPILFRFLKEYGKPVVWTLHDCWSFTGHCAHFVTVGCERWKNGCYSCPLRQDYPVSFSDRSSRNWQDKKASFTGLQSLTMVPVSEWLAGYVRKSFMNYADVRVIHNGIDLNVFKPCRTEKPCKFRIISVASVWYADKGLKDFGKLRSILPKDEYEIILVGLSPGQIEQLPLGIIGITRTDSVQKLAVLYSNSDVLVNATYADTFPTVNLEALACGTPVITYRTGGSPEAIDEKTGVVVPQGDINALVEAIKQMREKPLSSADCRLRAEKLFDKDKCFEEYVELFEKLIKQ